MFICSVWYLDRDSKRQAAIVVAVDVTHPPPAYCIRLEGADSTRDTEESRLEPRDAQAVPKAAQLDPDVKPTAVEAQGEHRSCCFLGVQGLMTL